MTLSSAGRIATQSLGVISDQISIVSRNISASGSSGYSAKIALLSSNNDTGVELDGVRRATNAALQRNALRATSQLATSTALSNALDQIDQSLNISSGSVASTGNMSPAALISQMASALQAYSATPSNAAAAQTALSSAQALAQSLNAATTTTQQIRQQADGQIATSVANINSLLAQFQKVNTEIVVGTQKGADITDSLDQRDALVAKLSQEVGVTTVMRSNNDMVLYTDSGATLFETTPRSVTFQPTPGLAPGVAGGSVSVDGVPITGAAAGSMAAQSGALVGLTKVRDTLAPEFQSQLDETARALINAFKETDQTGGAAPALAGLFTDAGASTIPGSLTAGLAGRIAINANVDPQQGGDITRLRDGGISSPGNPAYVYNTSGGSGYSARLTQLVNGLSASQSFDASAGLGTTASVTSYASDSVGWLESQRQQTNATKTYQGAVLTQTTQALSNATGVNLDDQMSQMVALENSYQASAKLLSTIDAMYQSLFSALHG
jgi:flagellar hook-associated protein 1 FlgK